MTFEIVERPEQTPKVEVKWTEQALEDLVKAFRDGGRAIRIPYRQKPYPVVHHGLLLAFTESQLSTTYRLRTKAQVDALYAWLEEKR